MRASILLASGAIVLAAACSSEKGSGPQACCDQPKIPPGVPAFTVVTDDVSGPSDGENVKIRVAFKQHTKRDEAYPAMKFLYAYAMKRHAFEPTSFVGEFYASEADAKAGAGLMAKIWRAQEDKGPKCDVVVKLEFAEQVKSAFDWSTGRGEEEDPQDTCHLAEKKKVARIDDKFTHKPSYKIDPPRKAVDVTYHYLDMGKDEYVESLTFNSAMTYWAEFTTTMFKKSDDLKEVTYNGILAGEPVVKITVTKEEFESKFSNVQETIAAHSAITFASLGLHKVDDKGALKEQESFKTKTYMAALSFLPKDHVTISPKLKKENANVKISPKGLKKG